jgi:hypothetical protein
LDAAFQREQALVRQSPGHALRERRLADVRDGLAAPQIECFLQQS